MKLEGRRFLIVAMGCRSNSYEGEALASALRARGAILSEENPDIIVVVTCTVTAQADMKTRKLIRKLRKQNREAYIVATGCYAQGASGEDVSALGVDLLVGNRLKHRIADLIEEHYGQDCGFDEVRARLDDNRQWDGLQLDAPHSHARAFIKIQDGCDHGCSYCIVPSVRGAPSSRSAADILSEVRRVADFGCSEVVLTGVHMGLYACDGTSLADIVRELARVPGVKRLRFSSIEPLAVTRDLLEALTQAPCFCPHLHIPLQSGDDAILKRMRRGYTRDDFYKTVEQARRFLGEDAHFSTDLMVGFPGETQEAFQNSLQLLDDLAFGRVHVFPFSPRAGTAAFAMEDRVSAEAVNNRVAEALDFSARLLDRYSEQWVGKSASILIEKAKNFVFEGWTRHYIWGVARGKGAFARRDEVEMRVLSSKRGSLFGDIMVLDSCVDGEGQSLG